MSRLLIYAVAIAIVFVVGLVIVFSALCIAARGDDAAGERR